MQLGKIDLNKQFYVLKAQEMTETLLKDDPDLRYVAEFETGENGESIVILKVVNKDDPLVKMNEEIGTEEVKKILGEEYN